jgi:hypothetical protein
MKWALVGLGFAILTVAMALMNARIRELEGRTAPPERRTTEVRTSETEKIVASETRTVETVHTTTAAPEVRETVIRILEELRVEENRRWDERVKRAGVDLLAKQLDLTPGQVDLATPLVEEHLKQIQSYWWPGTARDESGKERALTYEEKVRLSDEARAKMDDRVRLLLSRAQQAAYDEWVRKWREDAPKRSGEVGPLRWY